MYKADGRDVQDSAPVVRPLRHTAFHVLDDLLLHGRAFTRAGQHYKERTPAAYTGNRIEHSDKDRPPRRPPRGQISHIDFDALSPAPYPAAHLRRIHRESAAFQQSVQDSRRVQQQRHEGVQPCPDEHDYAAEPRLEPLRVVAERDASSRRHLKSMFRLATILWALLFVLTFCGYGVTLYMSKFWRVAVQEQVFAIPTWVHEVTAIGLVLELVVCIALGTRWRHYY